MKQTHLKTLSARIDELEQLRILNSLSFEEFTRLALDANKQSKIIVTLAHFVPCDANGVPLEKPYHFDRFEQYGMFAELGMELMSDCVKYCNAQKSVIFEGWEVKKALETYYLECGDWQIDTYSKEGGFRLFNKKTMPFGSVKHILIQSLADLAEATTENPIKLK